ncbi:PEP-CTERM sorting domain-containing protein [Pseudoduganella albidiflava]|uniref:PEP-CTERM sorting domain-containing protein n=1 Tax=Pseudoduganella albidiflava TaxID=321983 RepID=A0A411WSQ6_9BURK|nr:PEP-CTERM sorting domain-containing protein [Pseudoduganella albidiflava]QBH99638.1 PEP-CTERM sorting domain-containing protein [Pseudoduganella albidiflava]GGY46417.1 hypothetical protein GCM10007387_30690 [Pseudoduganella albidiflava]
MNRHYTVVPRTLRSVRLLGAIALLSAASSTLAADTSFSSSTVSNLRYTLTDLTPDDGIAANLTWTSGFVDVTGYHDGIVFRHFGDGSAPVAGSWTDGADNTAASFEPGTSFGNTVLSATVHADGADDAVGQANAAYALSYFDFTVSAGTAVTFYSDYEIHAGRTEPGEGTYATSTTRMELFDSGTSQDHFDSSWIEAATYQVRDKAGTASVSFSNIYGTDWTGTLTVQAAGQAFAGPLPVPEPSTYAMLGVGLLMLGAAARRRS